MSIRSLDIPIRSLSFLLIGNYLVVWYRQAVDTQVVANIVDNQESLAEVYDESEDEVGT